MNGVSSCSSALEAVCTPTLRQNIGPKLHWRPLMGRQCEADLDETESIAQRRRRPTRPASPKSAMAPGAGTTEGRHRTGTRHRTAAVFKVKSLKGDLGGSPVPHPCQFSTWRSGAYTASECTRPLTTLIQPLSPIARAPNWLSSRRSNKRIHYPQRREPREIAVCGVERTNAVIEADRRDSCVVYGWTSQTRRPQQFRKSLPVLLRFARNDNGWRCKPRINLPERFFHRTRRCEEFRMR